MSMAEARERRETARKLLANGIGPGDIKKAQKTAKTALAENSFETVAREWFLKHAPNLKENHSSKIITRLEKDIFPWLGARPAGEINAPELLVAIRCIESRGAMETAHRALLVARCSNHQTKSGLEYGYYLYPSGTWLRLPGGDHYSASTSPREHGEYE